MFGLTLLSSIKSVYYFYAKILEYINTQGLLKYCFIISVIVTIGSISLLAVSYVIITFIFPQYLDYGDASPIDSLLDKAFVIVIYPVIETFMVVVVLKFLRLFDMRFAYICLLSGLFFGIIHGLNMPGSFLSATWSFYVYSMSYLCFLKKSNFINGFIAAMIPHMFENGVFIFMQTIGA